MRPDPGAAPAPPRRRTVITGLGVISSIGTGVAQFTDGLRQGRSGVRPITAFDIAGFAHTNACELPDFVPERWISRLDPGQLGRATQLSIASTVLALGDAGLTPGRIRDRRTLIAVGTTYGESGELDRIVAQQVASGTGDVDRQAAAKSSSSRLSIDIARELGLTDAEAVTIPTACAAGNYAIGYGFDAVADGEVDVALCGGVDALLRMTFVTFYRLGTIAPQTCQPFDRNRKGILTAEGGAMLVLEDLDSAVARGARIYAEVLGYGLACDAHRPVAPDQRSVARCMARAHANAGISPGQVDYISAHGTGTKANDVTEVAAIRQVFAGNTPPVSSLKSMLGHAMGAASALAAAGCALALDNGFIPPTINHTEDDPEIDIDCVPNVARQAQLRVVQNDSLAFAGNDAVLILGGHGKNAHGTGPRGPRGERRHDARGNDGAHVTAPVITAWETYSPLGHGASAHVAGLRSAGDSDGVRPAVEGFEVREILGRARTRSMDCAAGLAVATTRRLLERVSTAGAPFGGYAPEEVGLVLGASDGVKSVMGFLRDTWTRDKPYDVDPSHVPRTLMNFAAGQCAIWHGVKGPNTTICGSHATGLLAMNYARRLQRDGQAKAIIWGAVEELSADRAAIESARRGGVPQRPTGEGCVMFLLESPEAVTADRPALAEVLAVEFGVWAEPGGIRAALAGCLRRALARASVQPDEIFAVAPLSSLGFRGGQERAAAADVLGDVPMLTRTAGAVGDTGAVSAAFQIVELLVQAAGAGRVGVATTADAEGRVGCALLRIC